MREISKTLSIISLLAPVGASALGIGDIKLHSALNQGFDAEIPLLTSATDASEIKVSLASAGAFARAGIDRHYFLSNLRFRPMVRANGRMVIKVTSNHSVQEPYLNFLVEVRSPSGRALKEFTVLLDPPSSFEQPTESAIATHEVDYTHRVSTVAEASPAPSVNHSRPAKSAADNAPSKKSKPKVGIRSGTYGPTVRNDTLSRIAKRIDQDPAISMEQMMVALYEANPGAFYKDNVNALKAGVKLKIPSRDAVRHISSQEARDEMKRQHAAWLGRTDVKTDVASVEKAAEKKVSKAAKTAEKSAQKPALETAQSESPKQLKLAVPSKSDVDGTASEAVAGAASAAKAERAFEMAETLTQENDDLRGRLGELEKQIASMQRLLTLKDEQLTALQTAQQQSKLAQLPKQASVPVSQSPEQANVSDNSPISTDSAQEGNVISSAQPAAKTVERPVEPAVKAIVVPKKQPRPPAQQDDWFSEILAEPLYLAAGGGIVLIAVLGWLISRRKRATADKAESILAVPANAEESSQNDEWVLPVVSDDTSTKSTVPADGSFLSEFALSDFDTLESEHQEVDAIAEADVYLAYGRYEQAETLIRMAIEADPSSREYKLKLFEIFYAAENKEAFESYASELRAENSVTAVEFWEKVFEMGRELCSDSPLFRPEESTTTQLSSDAAADNHGVEESIGEDKAEFELAGLDFDEQLSDVDEGLKPFAAAGATDLERRDAETSSGVAAVADQGSLNLDEPLEFEASPEPSQLNEDELEGGLLDDEWSGEDVELVLADSEDIEIDEAFNVLPLETQGMVGQDEAADDNRIDITSDSLTLELDDLSPRETNSEDDHPEDVYASLIDMDEIETKLDLAKAYVEMEDAESAHGILNEVLEEGNDEQKDEAQAISAALNVS